MFGLMRSIFSSAPPVLPSANAWSCLMGWRAVTYQEGPAGERWLSLQIEPMRDGACIVYVPSAERWRLSAPVWARGQREAILGRLRQVAWNRDLEWRDGVTSTFWHRHVDDPVEGSLESTQGGRQLQRMRLFDPDSPARRFSRRDSKRAWCAGAEQMCLQVAGRVSIDQSECIPGSVFQEIELPALGRNPRVTLDFAGVAA